MSRSRTAVLSAQIAGFSAALFLVVGRWSPERLLGIESPRYFELNRSMLLEPRQWVLPLLIFSVFLLRIPQRNFTSKLDLTASRYGRSAWMYLALLFVYLIASSAWAPELGFGLLKAYETSLTFGVLIVIGLWHLSTDAELFHQAFWKSLLLLTGILMVCALISLGTGRLAVLGGGPNVFARLMFLFAAGCMGLSARRQFYELAFAMIAIALIVLSGSRGGMLAAACGIFVYLWVERSKITSKFMLISGGMSLGALILFLTPLGRRVYEAFAYRIIELTLQDGHTSERDILFEEAVRIWQVNPIFGTGISGWAASQQEVNAVVASHPHNLFGEMLCEGGLIAVGLLALAILNYFRYVQLIRWRVHVPSFACAAMFFVASQFSGDFFDSRGIFVCAMLSTFPCSVRNKSIAISNRPPPQQKRVPLSRSQTRSRSSLTRKNLKRTARGER